MPIYRFEVSGVVEIVAPNIAQAWRYVRRSGRLREVARVSAGSGGLCPGKPVGRNIDWRQYVLSARSIGGTKRVKYLKPANAELRGRPLADGPA